MTGRLPSTSAFWAITCYFNPMRYQRRLINFRIFRDYLQIPLLAVELGYGPEFELQSGDAEILVQLRGGAVLWQKERLLNVALKALPLHCQKVAWLDCDLFFADPDWVESANCLLDQYAIIQLFRRAYYLGRTWKPGDDCASQLEHVYPSATYSLAHGVPAKTCFGGAGMRRATHATGLAWAARREVLAQHSFYDACIVGGGDRAIACAAHNCLDEVMQMHAMNDRQRQRYVTWAEPYHKAVRAEAVFVDVDLFHLWHGDILMRKPRARHHGLQTFQFDPYTDIATDRDGPWRWSTDRPLMHDYVREYFASRMEDG
jgi:hypothetical protein